MCGILREQVPLRKSRTPRKSPERQTFLSLAFYNAPGLHTVSLRLRITGIIVRGVPRSGPREVLPQQYSGIDTYLRCIQTGLDRSWFSERGWGQQLLTFQSPAVHWKARTSSLNCLSCRKPLPNTSFTELPPPFSLKTPFFHWNVLRRIPIPKHRLRLDMDM